MKCLFDLADTVDPVTPDIIGAVAYDRFDRDPGLLVVAVVDEENRPVGLLERNAFALRMAGQYGRALYGGRPVSVVMEECPTIADGATPLEDFMRDRLGGGAADLLRGFIVTRNGRYAGVGSALSLLQAQNALIRNHAMQAQASLRAKSEFLAVMSHEIRTPLNGVLAIAEVIERQLRQDELRPYVRTILNSGETLLRLLNDALDLSRAEAGRLTLEEAPLHLAGLVNDIETLWRPRANDRGLRFQVDYDGDADIWVLGDSTRLKQVLNNLVGNALKFTASGGVDVRLRASRKDIYVTIEAEVRDTGPGIAQGDLDDLFKPFSQTEAGRHAGGAGLGLSICRQLIEKMDGAIRVDSAPGEGSVFAFDIVLFGVQDDLGELAKSATPIEAMAGAPHVLVVDDNATNRLVAETLLAMFDCTFESVENGALAVERATHAPFDLILMDVKMPIMDGLEATRRIRALAGAASRTPIIALTANADPFDAESYKREGMDAVVEKPIRPETLHAAMSDALRPRQSQAA